MKFCFKCLPFNLFYFHFKSKLVLFSQSSIGRETKTFAHSVSFFLFRVNVLVNLKLDSLNCDLIFFIKTFQKFEFLKRVQHCSTWEWKRVSVKERTRKKERERKEKQKERKKKIQQPLLNSREEGYNEAPSWSWTNIFWGCGEI